MSAPRVPPGWTREAADLVWEDWQGRLLGSYYAIGRPDDIDCRPDGAPALRAWAAVGAPVLAPAEDGRPSLAEWVNVCEAAGLVYDPAHGADAHISFRNSDTLLGVWVHVWNAHDVTMEVDSRTPQAIATPDALRAALDALAGGG